MANHLLKNRRNFLDLIKNDGKRHDNEQTYSIRNDCCNDWVKTNYIRSFLYDCIIFRPWKNDFVFNEHTLKSSCAMRFISLKNTHAGAFFS